MMTIENMNTLIEASEDFQKSFKRYIETVAREAPPSTQPGVALRAVVQAVAARWATTPREWTRAHRKEINSLADELSNL